MYPSINCFDLIKKYEGYSSKAYLCPANIPTIGWGNTVYQDGSKVKMGDLITKKNADDLLVYKVTQFAIKIEALELDLNQNQFDSIVSFVYNIGIQAFKRSSILRLISKNPNDPNIRSQFSRWVNGGGKKLPGLIKRRKDEMELYFKSI